MIQEQLDSYYFQKMLKYAKDNFNNGFTFNNLEKDIISDEFKKSLHDDEKELKESIKFWFFSDTYGLKNYLSVIETYKKENVYRLKKND